MTSNLTSKSRSILAAVLLFGLLHHADHALRVDHSGWPFLPQVTPYTFSLLIYPALALVMWADVPLRLKAAMVGLIAIGVIYAHIVIETPRMQYVMWAFNRSLEPQFAGVSNALCISSPTLGVFAVVIAMGVNILLPVLALSLWRDGRHVNAT
ncbi:hypothetical protein GCM10007973_07610 [Polymorphobacter multimanifer]|uniref:Uncharacterized protein n=1 Tax=Polymorphobacter multimanifer TaxID=1070431 RepID=A0A841L8W5_9SPHN|nr:hypothetical protein [Polymorphobacter multimanifer]MBB6228860.1 hypothetical protein [Polymorphobacter multimanifer]GGI73163.1 hypothetical protein GCM10007973_07610 [Polymorphobacter multimanifer]